jgi:2-methylisocitrate lyase-like PEP mutase family enzyme
MTASPQHFLALHQPGNPLLMPNPWDVGSALILRSLGFAALATTSSGFAATLGRPDGGITREQAIEHAAAVTAATGLPVNADLENGFADAPEEVAATAGLAVAAGLAGFSIEDTTGRADAPIYDIKLAAERVRAAAEAAHAGAEPLVLTARAENYLYDRADLADTIARLQAYQEAGADVLYAPGLSTAEDIRAVVTSVDRPVNVLAMANVPAIPLLAELGVARVSVGGAFAFAAFGALKQAAEELKENGTYGYLAQSKVGSKAARNAFSGGEE